MHLAPVGGGYSSSEKKKKKRTTQPSQYIKGLITKSFFVFVFETKQEEEEVKTPVDYSIASSTLATHPRLVYYYKFNIKNNSNIADLWNIHVVSIKLK